MGAGHPPDVADGSRYRQRNVRFWLKADIQPPSELRPLYPRKRTWSQSQLTAKITLRFF